MESYEAMRLRKRDLELIIERIPSFRNPRRDLEQYQTPSWLVAEIAFIASLRGDIRGPASDLGCGTGRIAAALALMGAEEVLCIDISCRDIEEAMVSMKKLGIADRVEPICWDLYAGPLRRFGLVVLNPPFGVHRRGADLTFLNTAMEGSDTIYSIHKYNKDSLKLIKAKVLEKGFRTEILGIYSMEIPAVFETHKRKIYRFPVALLRLSREEG
jgi:putative methylase